MADPTQPVRLLQGTLAATKRSLGFPFMGLVIMLVTCSLLTACGSEEGGGIRVNRGVDGPAAAPTGSAVATLAWNPIGEVAGYYIHYGTESPGSPGSCAYAQSTFSSTPTATVTGLAADTTYYFAVSSFNGIESACSDEVSTVTPSV
jgi:fibronectin type III domain protein